MKLNYKRKPMKDAEVIKVALDHIGGRWKTMIIWELKHGPKRFSDLKTEITGITQKMLTSSLVEMQKDGLLVRKSFPQIPPRVEYTLTTLGESLLPISAALFEWGALNQGMELKSLNWKKSSMDEDSFEVKNEPALDISLEAADSHETVLSTEIIQAELETSTEDNDATEKVTEELVENDPWFFAPMPQKNVAKKKTSKKSSSNDSGTQQLGLF